MRRHGQAALHVGDPGPDQPIALAAQGAPRDRAEREDGVVVAEQRHARPPAPSSAACTCRPAAEGTSSQASP